ncbi:MAG: protein BatD [Nitrospirae bacterium]|nr:protein BatD [Nitrospirota bacterium]
MLYNTGVCFRGIYKILYKPSISAALLSLAVSVMASAALASGVSFEIALSKTTLIVGEGAQLSLTFNGDRGAPQPPTPQLDGFSVNYNGSATRMSIINGSASSSITYNYFIVPMKTGDFKIGPLAHDHDGKTYTSNEITVSVVDSPGAAPTNNNNPPPPAAHAPREPSKDAAKGINDRVFVTLKPSKTTVYANEIFTVRVKLFVRDISVREVSFPQLGDSGFSVGNFDKPVQARETINGQIYDTVEFTTTAFAASASNSLKLGPATLKCNIMVRANVGNFPRGAFDDDFFSNFFSSARAEAVELKSEGVVMKVLPLPEEGKPKGSFKGAIGSFDLDATAEPHEVKTGDPVTLKMAVTGRGNFNSVTAPDTAESSPAIKYYEPQVKQDKTSKIFEQAVIPQANTVQSIPEIVFSFFDPDKKAYQTIKKGPFPIKVTGEATSGGAKIIGPAQVAGENKPVEKEILGRDVVFVKERPGALVRISDRQIELYRNPTFIVLLLVPPLLYIGAVIYARRNHRLRRDVKYARGLRAPKKAKQGLKAAAAFLEAGKEKEFYDAVHKTIYDYLGDKLHMPPGEIMSEKIFQLLEDKGLQTGTLKEIFEACDMTRYARGGLGGPEMQTTFKRLEDFIDQMQRIRL